MKNLPFIFLFLTLVIFNYSCKKSASDKPWDELAKLDPQEWAPKNINMELPTITQRNISWEYAGDYPIEGFKIDRKRGDEDWLKEYAHVGKDANGFNDTITPDQNTTYAYKVYAYAGNLNSSMVEISDVASFPAPENLRLEKRSDISYRLSWDDKSIGEEGFLIDRKIADHEWVSGYATLSENTTAYLDTNIFEGKSSVNLEYRVYAFYKNYYSDKIEANTMAALTPPSFLNIYRANLWIFNLQWTDNSTGEDGFKIERKIGTEDWIELGSTTNMEWQDHIYGINAIVYYRVYAYKGNVNSAYVENHVDGTLPAPTNLEITRNTITSITLNWQDGSGGELPTIVERKHAAGDWVVLDSMHVSSWQDNDFELNTMIYYRVSHTAANLVSEYAENNIYTVIPTPEEFTFVVNTPTSISLFWEYPTTGHEGFYLERKVNQGNWTVVATAISHDTYNYTDNQIELLENDYSYRISAFVNGLFSDYNTVNYNKTPSVNNPTTGRIWMDRNLGAERIAQSSSDAEALGDLYQWGRRTDGHEKRNSATTATLSNSDTPEHGNFIVVNRSPYDWRSPQNNDLWQGVNGKNNPCPMGYRLPTEAEWEAERESWSSNDANGAFNSPLKLTVAGTRNLSNGTLYNTGSVGYYWSASVDGSSARNLYLFDNVAYISSDLRANGRSVRCIKD